MYRIVITPDYLMSSTHFCYHHRTPQWVHLQLGDFGRLIQHDDDCLAEVQHIFHFHQVAEALESACVTVLDSNLQ